MSLFRSRSRGLGTVSEQSLANALRERRERDLAVQSEFDEPPYKVCMNLATGKQWRELLTADEIHAQDGFAILTRV